MNTKGIPAIVMLIAGGIYCSLGIIYQIPLMDFCVQLLIVLLIFWILGGSVKMALNHFLREFEDKTKEEKKGAKKRGADSEVKEELDDKKE